MVFNRTTTDNGRNILKAFHVMLTDGLTCNVSDDEDNDEEEEVMVEITKTNDNTDMNVSANDCFQVDVEECEEQNLGAIGTLLRRSCFCHSLNLVIGDLVNKAFTFAECEPLKKAIDKCNAIAALSHSSGPFSEAMPSTIPKKAPTRWNYQVVAIEALLKVKPPILLAALKEANRANMALGAHERAILHEFVTLMIPISYAMKKAQSNDVTIASVIPLVLGIRRQVGCFLSTRQCMIKVKEQIIFSINQRFEGIFRVTSHPLAIANLSPESIPYSDPVYMVATILDPRRHLHFLTQTGQTWTEEDRNKYRGEARKLLLDEASSLSQPELSESQSSINSSSQSKKPKL